MINSFPRFGNSEDITLILDYVGTDNVIKVQSGDITQNRSFASHI